MNLKQSIQDKVLREVAAIAQQEKIPAYVVGGFVRDLLLKRDSKDIDIVVAGDGIAFARKVASRLGKRQVSVYENFGTAMFRYQDREVEFVGARKESYRKNSRKPIVESGSLYDDQLRRDFTINALAISLNKEDNGELIDPFNGLQDLQQKILRTPANPDVTFSDDPLRMMRAIRFAAQLGFSIEQETYAAIARNAGRISIVSMERITAELNKIIMSPMPSVGFLYLYDTGLLQYFFPELAALKGVENVEGVSHKDNFYHTLEVLDNIASRNATLWLRWAALLHDIGKPQVKKYIPSQGWTFHGHEITGMRMVPAVFRRLKLPVGAPMKYVQKMVMLHLRPIALVSEEVTDSAVRRLLFDAGDDIDDLMMLCEVDITSKNEKTRTKHLNNFQLVRKKLREVEEKDALRNFQPPIDGKEIMKTFNLPPCKQVGEIKNAIKEAILEGIIGNNREEAWNYMMKLAGQMGLTPTQQ